MVRFFGLFLPKEVFWPNEVLSAERVSFGIVILVLTLLALVLMPSTSLLRLRTNLESPHLSAGRVLFGQNVSVRLSAETTQTVMAPFGFGRNSFGRPLFHSDS